MFTGIIQEIGIIKQIIKKSNAMSMTIISEAIINDVSLGDSIAVNGVCLTVGDFNSYSFTVDIIPETFHATSLRFSKESLRVNLESALTLNTKMGGHFVSGHVDGVGDIIKKDSRENALYFHIRIKDPSLLKFCMVRGSITIDGTSLTIFAVRNEEVVISLIPHTSRHTILGTKNIGDVVNIECDMLAKLTNRLLNYQSSCEANSLNSNIDLTFLEQNGF